MGIETHKQVSDNNDIVLPQVVTDQSTGSVVIETSSNTIPSSQEATTSGSIQEVTVSEISIHKGNPVNTDYIVRESNITSSTSSLVRDTTNQEGNSPKLCPTSPTETGEHPTSFNTTSQEVTNTPNTVSQDVTAETPIDPYLQKRKEHLRSLGLSDSVYSNNSETFYPVLTPEQHDVDYISFKDIIDTAWSVPLENLSANDIELEQAYLKSCRTSSPKPVSMTAGSSSSSTIMLDSPLDSEKDDRTYGRPKKPTMSLRPCRKPSSAWIAAQKLILKTKGTRPPTVNSQKHRPESPKTCSNNKKTNPSKSTEDNAAKLTVKLTTPSADEKSTNKPKCYGLKITHHGIVRQPTNKKGRVCTCDMCGEKFKNSTLFITHYSTMHPHLNCKRCSKSYTNLLSLQKHEYMHKAEKKTCDSCGKAFAFQSQLSDHWKTHLKTSHLFTPELLKGFYPQVWSTETRAHPQKRQTQVWRLWIYYQGHQKSMPTRQNPYWSNPVSVSIMR